jgi:hypothetical protein
MEAPFTMVVVDGIDRRVALYQDDAHPSRVKERHVPAGHGGQMPAADDLCIEARALCDVAHRNTEMGDGLDCNHVDGSFSMGLDAQIR